MSELSNKIRALRGELSAEEAADKCQLSRESFYRVERGGSVKLATLKQIAKGFKLPEAEWLELLTAWLRTEAATDADKLWIEPKSQKVSRLRDREESTMARALMLFQQLNPSERQEIEKAMERKAVRDCLPAINRVWDIFQKEKSSSASMTEPQKRILAIVKGGPTGSGDVPPKE
jgi:transcriptional regulator with XRE-family HTH domain